MSPDFLQFGALGLLAATLVGVGFFLKGYLNREQIRQEQRDRDERQDRRDSTAAFTALIERGTEANKQLVVSFAALCAQIAESDASISAAMKEVTDGLKAHEVRASERHTQQALFCQQQIEQNAQIIAALGTMNKKT